MVQVMKKSKKSTSFKYKAQAKLKNNNLIITYFIEQEQKMGLNYICYIFIYYIY